MKKTKRILAIVLIMVTTFVLFGCSSNNSKSTLSTFIQSYTDEGIEVDEEEKPFFEMIGAKDGIIFYMDDDKVAIYEFESTKAVEKAKKDFSYAQDWLANGRFLLETDNKDAIDIFNTVK